MFGRSCRLLLALVLAGAAARPALPGAGTADEHTDQITLELARKNPAAAQLFGQANRARELRNWGDAERLYREVQRLEPGFVPATERLCGLLLNEGRRGAALTLCRQALAAADTPENRARMLWALVRTDQKTRATPEELREARTLATLLLKVPDADGALLNPVCAAAMAIEDLGLLRACVGRLELAAPTKVPTHDYAWNLAMTERDFDAADVALERARRFGLPERNYDAMRLRMDEERKWRLLPVAGAIVVAWATGLLALLGLGLVLSRPH